MSTETLIRITVFANRNPKISEEEYHKHWAEKHAPLVSSWLQRHGVVKYTQVSPPDLLRCRKSQKEGPTSREMGGSQRLSVHCLSVDGYCVGYNMLHSTISAAQEHIPATHTLHTCTTLHTAPHNRKFLTSSVPHHNPAQELDQPTNPVV
jgi:hypothetical protein